MTTKSYVIDDSTIQHHVSAIISLADRQANLYELRHQVLELANAYGCDRVMEHFYKIFDKQQCSKISKLRLLPVMLFTVNWLESNHGERINQRMISAADANHPAETIHVLAANSGFYAYQKRCDLTIESLVSHFNWAFSAEASNLSPLLTSATFACSIFNNSALAVDFAGLAYTNSRVQADSSDNEKAIIRFMFLNANRLNSGSKTNLSVEYDAEIKALEKGTLKLIVENHCKLPVYAAGEALARDKPDLARAERLLSLAQEIGSGKSSYDKLALTSTLAFLKLKQGNASQALDLYFQSSQYDALTDPAISAVRTPLIKGLNLPKAPAAKIETPASFWAWRKLQLCANKCWEIIRQQEVIKPH